jgi:hypothetical protein
VALRDASLVIHSGNASTSAAALSSSALKLAGGTERNDEFNMNILQRFRLIQSGFHNVVCVHRQQVLFHLAHQTPDNFNFLIGEWLQLLANKFSGHFIGVQEQMMALRSELEYKGSAIGLVALPINQASGQQPVGHPGDVAFGHQQPFSDTFWCGVLLERTNQDHHLKLGGRKVNVIQG